MNGESMRKANTNRRKRNTVVKEVPEVDFSLYRIRRNPYAERIAREGIELAHNGPAAAALAEMPEADFSRARVRLNKYSVKAAEVASNLQYGKGRPRKGAEIGETSARTLRLPRTLWKALEREARERTTTVHALLRELVAAHITGNARSYK